MKGCTFADTAGEYHGFVCTITGGACMFLYPNSKECMKEFGEGPDMKRNKCEECNSFLLEDGKRCCTEEPLTIIEGEIIKSKYIDKDTVCCGGFRRKE